MLPRIRPLGTAGREEMDNMFNTSMQRLLTHRNTTDSGLFYTLVFLVVDYISISNRFAEDS